MAATLTETSNTTLDYSMSTAPEPVTVSTADQPSTATLTIVVSNHQADSTVTKIEIQLPVGDPGTPAAADLTEIGTGIGCSVSDPAWEWLYPHPNGCFTIQPKDGKPIVVGDQGLAITLSGIVVNQLVGTAPVTITETATDTDAAAAETTATLSVPKFPFGFAAGNFRLDAPLVAHGTSATLSWFGTRQQGTTYKILWDGNAQDVSDVTTWASPPLDTITTFLLEVTADGPSGTVHLWFSTTVVVADPDLVATSLQVSGPTTLNGAAAANGTLTAAGAVAANGGATVAGPGLTVNGPTTANGDSHVTGALTAASLGVAGLAASGGGTAITGDLTGSGQATFQGGLTANGDVRGGSIKVGDWTFYQDGNHDLILSNGDQGIRITRGSPITMFILEHRVLVDGDPVTITNDKGFLNSTTQGDRSGPGNQGMSYWTDSPDGDSNLQLHFGNPY